MKHVMYFDRSLFMDDETADLLVAYADALNEAGGSDSVRVPALDSAGNDVDIRLLLNGPRQLVVETALSPGRTLRDEAVVEYLSANLRTLTEPSMDSAPVPGSDDADRIGFDDVP